MATPSSILAWGIHRQKEPGGLQSMGLQRVRHDLVAYIYIYICQAAQLERSQFPIRDWTQAQITREFPMLSIFSN